MFTTRQNPDMAAIQAIENQFNTEAFIGGSKGFVRDGEMIKKYSVDIANTTGLDLLVVIAKGKVRVLRSVLPDVNTKYKAMGGGLVLAPSADVQTLYDDVQNFAAYGIANVHAVLTDGIAYADQAAPTTKQLVVTGRKRPVAAFHEFIEVNPSILHSIVVNSQNKEAFETQINVHHVDFENTDTRTIDVNDYLDKNQFQNTKVDIELIKAGYTLQLDDQTVISMVVPGLSNGVANVKMSLQFNLVNIANIARDNFRRNGGTL